MENTQLARSLGPAMIWGLGVGYVISGEYFGWNLGLPVAGTYGMLGATLLVTVMYVAFVLSYAELACALPRAGGAFVYATRALEPDLGYLAGLGQLVEFVMAPPAIAMAIGAYFQLFVPDVDARLIAAVAYLLFTGLNIWGVRHSAIFEMVVTVLAVGELLVFCGIAAPSFSVEAFTRDPLPNGWGGMFAALPFAIWFYLAIEGLANVAEEARNPQRDLSRGFAWAMVTLAVLAVGTLVFAVGVDGWPRIVYDPPGSETLTDRPLPLALGVIVGPDHIFYHGLVLIGLFGLVASFHGILLAAGRCTLEFGRVGFAPAFLGHTHPRRFTPVWALVVNAVIGLLAVATGRTADILTVSVFGALTLYLVSMIALFRLRKNEPALVRPFRVPLYPLTPLVALSLTLVCLAAMLVAYWQLGLIYLGVLAVGFVWFRLRVPADVRNAAFKQP